MYDVKFGIGEKVYYMHGNSVCFSPVCRIKVEDEGEGIYVSYKVFPPNDEVSLILLEENLFSKISDLFERLQNNIIKND